MRRYEWKVGVGTTTFLLVLRVLFNVLGMGGGEGRQLPGDLADARVAGSKVCVGYPIPSARAAVRKVPLGGDNLGPGRGKNSRSLREDANGPDAGLWAPRIMKRYAWKVFGFRLLLCTSEWERWTRSGFRVESSFVVVEKRWGTRDVEEEKGKWVRTKGRAGWEKWREGCHKMPGGRVLGPLAGERGTGGKAGNIEREKIRPVLAVYGHGGHGGHVGKDVYRPT